MLLSPARCCKSGRFLSAERSQRLQTAVALNRVEQICPFFPPFFSSKPVLPALCLPLGVNHSHWTDWWPIASVLLPRDAQCCCKGCRQGTGLRWDCGWVQLSSALIGSSCTSESVVFQVSFSFHVRIYILVFLYFLSCLKRKKSIFSKEEFDNLNDFSNFFCY